MFFGTEFALYWVLLMRDFSTMMKRSAYPLFVGLLGSFLAVPAVPAMAQEGAGELGAPTRVEEVTPAAETPAVPVPATDAPVVAVPAVAAAPVFRGSQMTAGGRVYELGCNAGMHFVFGPTVYVQCAGAVVVVDTANASATTFAVAGMPTNFFEQGGRVWVELNHDTAHPVASLPSLAPQAAPAPNQYIQPGQPGQPGQLGQPTRPGQLGPHAQQAPAEPAPRGEVIRVVSGEVYVQFTTVPELYAGTRVAFTADGMNPVVGTLVTRAGEVFIARVAYGETVPVGAAAAVTDAPATGSSTIPQRSSSFRLAMTARGLIGAGEDGGGGIIADIDAEWRLRAPVFLRLIVDPVGVGFGEATVPFGGAHILAGFDSSFLAIGLGLGFQLVEADFEDDFRFSERRLGIGTSIGFLLRVGSPEGFYVELFNAMTYVDKFRFGSLRIRAQWGLGHRNWMVIRGGGGVTRAAYGEVGFRRLLSGWSGDEGALFLTASFGGSAIYTDLDSYELYAGPTFGITLEKIW